MHNVIIVIGYADDILLAQTVKFLNKKLSTFVNSANEYDIQFNGKTNKTLKPVNDAGKCDDNIEIYFKSSKAVRYNWVFFNTVLAF